MTTQACHTLGGHDVRRHGAASPRSRELPAHGIHRSLRPVLGLTLALLAFAGCGRSDRPPLGSVRGTVTLDGVPLPAALVVFTPDGPGRSAVATTDTAGRYELVFLRDIAGATVGTHTVRITTAGEEGRSKEILPARYHAKTELVATVQPGDNALDFPLRSK